MYKFLLIAIVLFFIILYINNSNLQNFNNFIITHKNRGDRSGSFLLIDLLFYVFALKIIIFLNFILLQIIKIKCLMRIFCGIF